MRAPVWGALAQFKQTSEIFGWLDAIVRNMDVPDLKPPPSRVASPLVVSMGVNTKREQTHQVSTGGACKRWPVHVCVALFFLASTVRLLDLSRALAAARRTSFRAHEGYPTQTSVP